MLPVSLSALYVVCNIVFVEFIEGVAVLYVCLYSMCCFDHVTLSMFVMPCLCSAYCAMTGCHSMFARFVLLLLKMFVVLYVVHNMIHVCSARVTVRCGW